MQQLVAGRAAPAAGPGLDAAVVGLQPGVRGEVGVLVLAAVRSNATKHNDGNELGGTWQLFYKATSKELPWNATEFEVAAAVRSISQGVGVSAVTRTRSNFTGAYNWRVEFVEKAPDVLVALTGKLSGSWGAQKMKVRRPSPSSNECGVGAPG